jgi:hypothetical protein
VPNTRKDRWPRFALHLDKDGRVQRKCEVMWTDARFVGVKFV